MEDLSLSPLERQILDALSPEKAAEYLDGADPSTIYLADGTDLATFIGQVANKMVAPDGSVFFPVANCVAINTDPLLGGAGGIFGVSEQRNYVLRGAVDLSPVGGPAAGCGIPGLTAAGGGDLTNTATALVVNIRARAPAGSGRFDIFPTNGVGTGRGIVTYRDTSAASFQLAWNNALIIKTCDDVSVNPCSSGDVSIQALGVDGAHVQLTILGYFAALGVDGHSLDAADGAPTDALLVDNFGDVTIGGDLTVSGQVDFLTDLDVLDDLQVGSPGGGGSADIYTTGTGLQVYRVGGPLVGELRTNADNDFVLQANANKLRTQGDLYLQFSDSSSFRDLFAGEVKVNDSLSIADSSGVVRGQFSSSNNNVDFFDGTGDGHLSIRDRLHVTGDSTDAYITLGTSTSTRITFEEGPNQTTDLNILMGSSNDGRLRVRGGLTVDKNLTASSDLDVLSDLDVFGNIFMHSLPTGSQTGSVCFQDTVVGDVFIRCASSKRFKKDIVSFTPGVDAVQKLRPVTFRWKGNGQPDVGFVAEEVAAVDPLLVTYGDGQIEGVKYDRLTTLLVNAVQEQEAEIEKLKAIVCLDHPEAVWCQ